MMASLGALIKSSKVHPMILSSVLSIMLLVAQKGDKFGEFELAEADDFEYKDPVDKSVSSKQGIRFVRLHFSVLFHLDSCPS